MDAKERARWQIQAIRGLLRRAGKEQSSARATFTRKLAALHEAQFRAQTALSRLDANLASLQGNRPN
jgi:hypothetical protein